MKKLFDNHKVSDFIIIVITSFFVFGYIIYPLGHLIWTGLHNNHFEIILKKQFLDACFNSLFLSIITVIGSALIGVYFAYTFHLKRIFLKKILSAIILLPIAIPPIVSVLSYTFLLGDNGLLARLTGWNNIHFSGWGAIMVIHFYSFYPLVYLFVGNALKTIDSSILEASYILGASKNKTFIKIILPEIKISLLSSSMLVFMASMASFSAPFIYGGNLRFLTTEIYYSKINGDFALSSLLSVCLIFISLIALLIFKYFSNKEPKKNDTKGVIKTNQLIVFKNYSYSTSIVSIIFSAIVLLPLCSLLIISLVPDNFMMESSSTLTISLENYRNLFKNDDFILPFINSFNTSILAVIITLIAGLFLVKIITQKNNKLKYFFETIVSIPYGIPGTVIAICLILSFNQPTIFSMHSILIGTFWILPIAYSVRNIPVITQSIKTGRLAVGSSYSEASWSLGASNFRTWRLIILPLLLPSIIDGSLLVFINSFGEFVSTVLLYNYSSKTLSIEIYSQMRLFNYGIAGTYGIIIFLIIILLILVTRKLRRIKK